MSAFNFAELKAQCRQSLHEALAVSALYSTTAMLEPVAITVRWHNKINRVGNMEDRGYAEIIEGIDRMIFNLPELALAGITTARGAIVTITEFNEAKFVLEAREPSDGPVEVVWLVTPK